MIKAWLKSIGFVWGRETPSAMIHKYTAQRGPYFWYGVLFGRCFIGFMFSRYPVGK